MIYIIYTKVILKGEKLMKDKIYEVIFALLLLIGIVVCTICDIAISNAYTWSLIPISSIVFAWVALLPIKRYGKKGIWASLIILNTCIITYLYAVNNVVKDKELIFTVGRRMSAISVIYLICIFAIFKIFKKRKFAALSTALFLGIPICIIINVNLSEIYSQSLIDIWDLLAIITLLILSIVFFVYDINSRKK